MCPSTRRTARRRAGDRAEDYVLRCLATDGWTILGTGVAVGRDELDLVAVEPGEQSRACTDAGTDGVGALVPAPTRGTLVFVEVRSHSTARFGTPEESITPRKLRAVYRAALTLLRIGRLPDGTPLPDLPWRVDVIAVETGPAIGRGAGGWCLRHVRGVTRD